VEAMTTISARAGKSAPSTVVVGNERASASVASPRIPHRVSTTASRGVRGAAVTSPDRTISSVHLLRGEVDRERQNERQGAAARRVGDPRRHPAGGPGDDQPQPDGADGTEDEPQQQAGHAQR